jgi:hypothetical protein
MSGETEAVVAKEERGNEELRGSAKRETEVENRTRETTGRLFLRERKRVWGYGGD